MFDNLFSDPGRRIKSYAGWCFVIGAIAFVIGGIVVMVMGSFLIGLLWAGLGTLILYLSSLMIYAFGELVESTKYAKISSEKTPSFAPAIREPAISDELPEL